MHLSTTSSTLSYTNLDHDVHLLLQLPLRRLRLSFDRTRRAPTRQKSLPRLPAWPSPAQRLPQLHQRARQSENVDTHSRHVSKLSTSRGASLCHCFCFFSHVIGGPPSHLLQPTHPDAAPPAHGYRQPRRGMARRHGLKRRNAAYSRLHGAVVPGDCYGATEWRSRDGGCADVCAATYNSQRTHETATVLSKPV